MSPERPGKCPPTPEVSVRPLPAAGSVRARSGERREVGDLQSPGGELCGPGTCGKEEWPPDSPAGHPPDLVGVGSEAVERAQGTLGTQPRKRSVVLLG